MKSMGKRRQDLSRRPVLMVSRIVSRSLFDVPVNNVGPAFSARGSQSHALPSKRAVCLEPLSDPARGPLTYNKPKTTGSSV